MRQRVSASIKVSMMSKLHSRKRDQKKQTEEGQALRDSQSNLLSGLETPVIRQ